MADDMRSRFRNRDVNDALHPSLYRAMIALTIFWAIAAGSFLVAGGYSNVVLGVVGMFVFMTLAIPLTLRRIVRHHGFGQRRAEAVEGDARLYDWLDQRLDVWGDEMKGSEAALIILTVPGAVCLQAIAFVIIFHVLAP